jgi:serine/threonine-protein kinase
MAPEQATGASVDRRADIWAIGSIAYHLLAGKPPFEGANQLATLHQLTLGRPPAPIANLHPSVQAIVTRALMHDPTKRFATALEMQSAIEKAMIEAKVPTSINDVAAYCAEHIGDRAVARRSSVETALKAAQERARLASIAGLTASEPASQRMPVPIAGSESLAAAQRKKLSSASDHGQDSGPISETSSATLGSAGALASPVPAEGQKRTALVVGSLVAVATIAAAAAVALLVMKPARDSHGDSASRPPAASAAAPASAPPLNVPPPTPTVAADPVVDDAGAAPDPSATASAPATTTAKRSGFGMPWGAPTPKPTATTSAQAPRRPKADPDGF